MHWNTVFSLDKTIPRVLLAKLAQMLYRAVSWTATFSRYGDPHWCMQYIYVIVGCSCGADIFSKRIYLMEVMLSCVTKLRLSLVAMQALCLMLAFFDLWYQMVLVCIVTFFQGEKIVLNSAYLKRRILCADMLKEQSCSSAIRLNWGLVRNVWVKQIIQNLLIQYCGMGVNKWCLTFCWSFFDLVPRLVESCENASIDSSFSFLWEITTDISKFQNRN